jgi:hypothetical protein
MELSMMVFYLSLLAMAIVRSKSYVYQLPFMALNVAMLIDMGLTTHGLFDMVVLFVMLLIPMFNIVINTMVKNDKGNDDIINKL